MEQSRKNPVNIFHILALSRSEDPHDRLFAWLCDPDGGHGITDFAAHAINTLWMEQVDEAVIKVQRQYQLAADSWPDVVVEFSKSLLVVENKVNASALREGQLERQHELALAKQGDKPLYHILLCPDRFLTNNYGPDSRAFRVLTYGRLAALLRELSKTVSDLRSQPILEQYADYIDATFGKGAPPGVRLASARAIALRNEQRQVWSESQFLERANKHSPGLFQAHTELLDLLRSMESVEPRFDSAGPSNATYKVYLADTNDHPLWVYEDGGLYVQWGPLGQSKGASTTAQHKLIWKGLINHTNVDGAFATGGLLGIGVEEVARKLQVLADFSKNT